tara:strand:- start:176 stop:379 length:204 start_codon:yes stop_codon:yes gene_type:complete
MANNAMSRGKKLPTEYQGTTNKKIAQGKPGSGVSTNEAMDKTLKRLGIKKEDLEKHQTSGMGQRWKI